MSTCFVLAVIICISVTFASEVSTSKLLKSTLRSPFNAPGLNGVGAMESSGSLVTNEQSVGPIEAIREEIVDFVEGFTYAESREEVFDHLLDVVDRSKAIFGIAAGTYIAKSIFFNPRSAQKIAKDVSLDMRAAEAAKWGRRAM